jgi:hypothetical protein
LANRIGKMLFEKIACPAHRVVGVLRSINNQCVTNIGQNLHVMVKKPSVPHMAAMLTHLKLLRRMHFVGTFVECAHIGQPRVGRLRRIGVEAAEQFTCPLNCVLDRIGKVLQCADRNRFLRRISG